jgi:hypothetical protein
LVVDKRLGMLVSDWLTILKMLVYYWLIDEILVFDWLMNNDTSERIGWLVSIQ